MDGIRSVDLGGPERLVLDDLPVLDEHVEQRGALRPPVGEVDGDGQLTLVATRWGRFSLDRTCRIALGRSDRRHGEYPGRFESRGGIQSVERSLVPPCRITPISEG